MKYIHEVIYNGKPDLKNMSKTEFNIFCKSLLDVMLEERQIKEKLPAEQDSGSNEEKNNL